MHPYKNVVFKCGKTVHMIRVGIYFQVSTTDTGTFIITIIIITYNDLKQIKTEGLYFHQRLCPNTHETSAATLILPSQTFF